jgi:hypothetical protein
MPFYEVTYETGRMSVAQYEDDAEAQRALGEHHQRAMSGQSGGPLGQPAERIAKVRVYDKHPNEYNPDQTMSKDVLKKEVTALMDALADENGVVSIDQLTLAVRGLTHPMVTARESTFDSMFLMQESRELELA